MSIACNYSSCFGDLYFVWSVVMVVISLVNYCTMVHCPLSSHWTTTVDPFGIDVKIFEVSLPWSFLPCLCIKVWWCSSSLSICKCRFLILFFHMICCIFSLTVLFLFRETSFQQVLLSSSGPKENISTNNFIYPWGCIRKCFPKYFCL